MTLMWASLDMTVRLITHRSLRGEPQRSTTFNAYD